MFKRKIALLLILVFSFSFAYRSTKFDYMTIRKGLNQTPIAITAGTSISDSDATIPAGTSMVKVTSATANNFIVLPTPVQGQKIDIICDATNAFEIRPVLQTQFINGTECTPNKELLAPAGSIFHATAVVAGSAGKWVITQTDDDGTTDAGGTPD